MTEQYVLDLTIRCPHKKCKADVGKPCVGLNGIVHFSRRLQRLLRGDAMPAKKKSTR